MSNLKTEPSFKIKGVTKEILDAAPSVTVAGSVEELEKLAVCQAGPDGLA